MHNEIGQSSHTIQSQYILRRQKDVQKLNQHSYDVQTNSENPSLFAIIWKGPEESIYKEGKWLIQVFLPDKYPMIAPSITFVNRIYHPNIDWK